MIGMRVVRSTALRIPSRDLSPGYSAVRGAMEIHTATQHVAWILRMQRSSMPGRRLPCKTPGGIMANHATRRSDFFPIEW